MGPGTEREFLRVPAEGAAERRAAWRKWVLGAVKDRPGLLYRWAKGKAQAPKVATTVDGRWTLDPREVVESEAAVWGSLWAPEGGERWVARPPQGPALAQLDGTALWEIARRTPVRAAAGADGWRAAALRALPKEFWDRLAEFLGVCEEVGKWPEPLRAGLVVLTPRPIVLLPLVYRIWAAARRPVGGWSGPAPTALKSRAVGRTTLRGAWR